MAVREMLMRREPRVRKAAGTKIPLCLVVEDPDEEAEAVKRGMMRSMTTDDAERESMGWTSTYPEREMAMIKYEPRPFSTPPSGRPVRIPKTAMSIADRPSFSSGPSTTTRFPEVVRTRKRERPALFLDLKKEVKPKPEPEKPRKRLWPFRRFSS
ncbi:hypothetical protein TWF506_003160 [Arthrobotrys conoides]|uniref:Uncharacterized protein n=1 Tax=Arthrobotrys conoides TaxID=74498 RepID=A0AAN8MYS6_9PEZI